MSEIPELMARVLKDSGMTAVSFDAEQAIKILINTKPEIPDCDKFNKLSFEVFLELMKLEIKNK